jgi:UDP-3-O-[3-hydroxymyristoyl] N-acetylglucosamine deacetylase
MKQRTIKKPVDIIGIGLHKGIPIKMRLEPLEDDSGIIFYRSDKKVSIPLKPENVVDTRMATVIGIETGDEKVVISTIEHMLSAIYAYGIDNLRIILDNDEIPILDGSSSGFAMLINEAGIKEQTKTKKAIRIKKDVQVSDGAKVVSFKPSNSIVYDFKIKFDHPVIGAQKFHFDYSISEYVEEISRARTFGFLHDLQRLRAVGLALGASYENAIALDEHKVLNPEGLRYPDEFVRHKILDAIGDMALLGYTIIGHYSSFAGSHHLNHLLTKEVLKDPENYEIVELGEALDSTEVFELAYAQA